MEVGLALSPTNDAVLLQEVDEAVRRDRLDTIMERYGRWILGAAVAAVAPIGDLFESMIKRDLGTKDTGNLFGPHGGLLDRLDAVFFTIVVGYYVAVALVY